MKKVLYLIVVLSLFALVCGSFFMMESKGSSSLETSNHIRKTTKIKPKPTIYTFWESVPGGCCGADEEGHQQLLDSWRSAWEDNGWETNLLSENDAKKHPDFDKLENLFLDVEISEYDKRCFYRWLAMAMLPEGGWMSDYDLFPLNFSGEESYAIVDKNDHGRFTSYANIVPALLYASKAEWQKMVKMMMDEIPRFEGEHFSDMYVFKELVEAKKKKAGIVYDTEEFVSRLGFENYKGDREVDCEALKSEKAIHFSHYSTGQAYDKGVFPIKEGEPIQNRGLAADLFMSDYEDQCVGIASNS